MKSFKTLLAATALTGMAASAATAETWDMPMAYPATNFHSENASQFAACVKEATGGALDIVTHAGGSLFSGSDIKRAVQTGQAPIGERLISAHANENPLFGVDSIPFLATSFADSDKLWAAARPQLEKVLADQNLVYIYAVPWPPQGFYFKKDVNSVADMAGIKFRAYNAATARIAELAGMAPVQIEAAELSQALATGVAEAFISSGATGVDSKVWESLTHFYDVQAWLPRNVVFANKDAFDALDDAAKKALTDCGDTAAASGAAKSEELTAGYLKTLADNGMTVSGPSEQLEADLAAFGTTMSDEWVSSAGEDGKAIIDAYRGQ
ncbi:C4-dicarboxylate ABC transporter substrate-binding protein [Aquibium carbonis]|uniref:C4-dicarboxylate ABC transporter substrate-binding protein n=2 Tax=Aquibium carbonis TaxID=2495581 RepID=A0A429YWB8_9HYPH|nr:TRAP transporter substrate-binding protein [Aquibium carbonis]RST85751.1 C4-dicarboxylate ABC transporter substrate-binding protein [Aquibium carbonis]